MRKKILTIFGCIVLLTGLAVLINFIPTWNLETKDMARLEGDWCNVYYETEQAAALDVFEFADEQIEEIAQKLGFSEKQDVNIFIYDSQKTMQRKKYGFIAPLLGLDWYIGDNIGTNVILTSPANPGPVHDYDNNKQAVLHEAVHAYISVENPGIQLWLTEGMALYLTNGEPFYKEYLEYMEIPAYEDTKTKNPIRFSSSGGYIVAHTYIEYLKNTYGWDKVCELLISEDYGDVFHKTQKEIYEEWVSYIKNYYQ